MQTEKNNYSKDERNIVNNKDENKDKSSFKEKNSIKKDKPKKKKKEPK